MLSFRQLAEMPDTSGLPLNEIFNLLDGIPMESELETGLQKISEKVASQISSDQIVFLIQETFVPRHQVFDFFRWLQNVAPNYCILLEIEDYPSAYTRYALVSWLAELELKKLTAI